MKVPCARAAIVGPLGFDETPSYWAVPQGSAEPRGATRASESARDFCHGLLGLSRRSLAGSGAPTADAPGSAG